MKELLRELRTRLRCSIGVHDWFFSYVWKDHAVVGNGGSYAGEIACMRCVARPTREQEAVRAHRCARGDHQPQALTAPPTWRQGDAVKRGVYCIWCATPTLGELGGLLVGKMLEAIPTPVELDTMDERPSQRPVEVFAYWPARAPESRW